MYIIGWAWIMPGRPLWHPLVQCCNYFLGAHWTVAHDNIQNCLLSFLGPLELCTCGIRVREIHLSLAGHFVRWPSSPSLNILNSRWTFRCKMSGEYQTYRRTSIRQILSLKCSRWTKCPSRSNPFIGHFQNAPDMSGESGEFRVLCRYL